MTSIAGGARLSARNPGLRSGPKVVETKPSRLKRSRRVAVDEDELNLATAK
jgi:hypothetical protein